jgi:hypothetical protein
MSPLIWVDKRKTYEDAEEQWLELGEELEAAQAE